MPTRFWAKRDESGEEHLLEHHSADVAACFEALVTSTLLGRRLARLAGREELSPGLVARLCVLAALHDAGKVNHGFQQGKGGHIGSFAAILFNDYPLTTPLHGALGVGEMLGWGAPGVVDSLLLADRPKCETAWPPAAWAPPRSRGSPRFTLRHCGPIEAKAAGLTVRSAA